MRMKDDDDRMDETKNHNEDYDADGDRTTREAQTNPHAPQTGRREER
jgi:hypothetical protein